MLTLARYSRFKTLTKRPYSHSPSPPSSSPSAARLKWFDRHASRQASGWCIVLVRQCRRLSLRQQSHSLSEERSVCGGYWLKVFIRLIQKQFGAHVRDLNLKISSTVCVESRGHRYHNLALQVFCHLPFLGCVHDYMAAPVYTTVLNHKHFVVLIGSMYMNLGQRLQTPGNVCVIQVQPKVKECSSRFCSSH